MLSLPKASTSGLPALRSPQELPDMTTAPNGELRRQDLHLQVQQLVSLRSLPWVPWASVPHLPRYYAPLRLPMAHLGVVRFSLSFPDPLGSRLLLCVPWSPKARVKGGRFLSTPGVFPTLGGTPAPDLSPRRPLALPSSRVTPVEACPALRPRWCPVYSPYRIQDCCLPVTAHRRLLPRSR
jgi:hypothetical protein